jgi:REP element-mobilizing transposase RayT
MYDPDIHHRRSIRLKDYDYSRAGAYFVTVCSWRKENMFGEIKNGEMMLNKCGEIVMQCWDDVPNHYHHARLDEFVIMPNHVHGIVFLGDPVGAGLALPTKGVTTRKVGAASSAPTLGVIMRTFKSMSTITANRLFDRQGYPLWQRNYYERIIRNNSELHAIREYIRYNPMKWDEDDENPQRNDLHQI